MRLRTDYIVAIMAITGWAAIAWIVVDYNMGFGSTTLHWPNPAHPTAIWTWDAQEQTPTILEADSGQWLKVTLPRGFNTGRLRIETTTRTPLTLRAESRDSEKQIVQSTNGVVHNLTFHWVDLIARGRTYRFRLENFNSMPLKIDSISMTMQR